MLLISSLETFIQCIDSSGRIKASTPLLSIRNRIYNWGRNSKTWPRKSDEDIAPPIILPFCIYPRKSKHAEYDCEGNTNRPRCYWSACFQITVFGMHRLETCKYIHREVAYQVQDVLQRSEIRYLILLLDIMIFPEGTCTLSGVTNESFFFVQGEEISESNSFAL